MAFHPALTNPDILRAIFEHVAVSCDSESEPVGHVFARRQLAWAARSCKPFCEPALNALWRKMDDLTPLFKILTVFQEVDGVYMIRGTINADNMTRFHQYACRVIKLEYYPDAGRRIDISVYFQLARLCGTRPLLPSLCDLRCSPSTEMLLFPSSTLSRLKLHITSDATDQTVGSFLFTLAEKIPSLTYLAVTGNLTRLALESISGFKELHSLDLCETTSMDMTILRAISAFVHLTRLDIDLRGVEHEPECIWDPNGFLSLRHLTVLCRDPSQVSWFLLAIHNCALRSVDVYVDSTQQEQAHGKPMQEFEKEWCQFFEKLPHQSLRHIHMGYLNSVPTLIKPIIKKGKKGKKQMIGIPPVRTRSIIGPLLQIRGLESVDFLSYPSLPLSDEDVHDIASAWPDIIILALPNAVTEQPTFASLQYLSTLCPHLLSLVLNIDSSNFSTVELTSVFPHPLRAWVAGDTLFDDTLLLAHHLNRIFPALDQIDGANSTESRIQELLHLCQAAAANERLRIASPRRQSFQDEQFMPKSPAYLSPVLPKSLRYPPPLRSPGTHVTQNTPHPTQPSDVPLPSSAISGGFSSPPATPSTSGSSELPRLNTNANTFVPNRAGSRVTIRSVDGIDVNLGSLKTQQTRKQRRLLEQGSGKDHIRSQGDEIVACAAEGRVGVEAEAGIEVENDARTTTIDGGKDGNAQIEDNKAKESIRVDTSPVKSTTRGISDRKRPDALDLTNVKEPTSPLRPTFATVRMIDDLSQVQYPQGITGPKIELNINAKDGKFRYDRDFLLQFMSVCKEKPDMLFPLDAICLEPFDQFSLSRGGSGRHRGPVPSSPSRPPPVGLGINAGPNPGGAFGKPGVPMSFNMGMGNFSTMPATKLSSDERFALPSGARAVSGPAGPMRSSNQGEPVAVAGSSMGRSKSCEKRNESDRVRGVDVGVGPSGDQQVHTPGFSMPDPMGGSGGMFDPEPLAFSGEHWVPSIVGRKPAATDSNSTEVVARKVRSLLNKLAVGKFDSISDKIITWANKSENEKNGRTLIQVIRLVFESATDEMYSAMFARLCRKMMEQISPNVQDDGIKNAEGKPIAGGQLFRKFLLNRCQEDFERGWVAKETTSAAAAANATQDQAAKASNEKVDAKEMVLYSEKLYTTQKARRQGLGLIKFIGELFKLQMLTERIMHECVKKLLGNMENPEEEEIERLCKLLATVGAILDTNKARAHMDVYFSRMKESVKSPNVTWRMQFLLQDVIELRERKWTPKNAIAAPSTLAQVHQAAALEKESYQRQMSMSRGGSRRGTDCGNKSTQPSGDGWAVAEPGSGPPRPTPKVGDLSNFKKITKSTPMTFGPSGTFAGKKDAKKETLQRSNSSSNMFSMLSQNPEGGGNAAGTSKHGNQLPRKASVDISQGASEPPQRKKLRLLPLSKPLEETALTVSPPPASDNGSDNDGPDTLAAKWSMNEKEALKKIAEDTKEFFAVRNLDEAEEYFTVLSVKHQFRLVDKLVAVAIESKETDAQLVAGFFARAVEKKLCGGASFEQGFMPTAELLDDIVFDAPKAFELMALMMKGAELDKDEERRTRIAGKSKVSDKLLALLLA